MTSPSSVPLKTTIDWLTFRTKSCEAAVSASIRELFGVQGDRISLLEVPGRDGWKWAKEYQLDGLRLGRVDYGGESQRGWVRAILYGEGCQFIYAWAQDGAACAALEDVQIRRVDIAFTSWKGEVTDSRVVQAWEAGGFTGGGRRPTMRSVTSTDAWQGKTRYVGSRTSEKFFRNYEKGMEILGRVPGSAAVLRRLWALECEPGSVNFRGFEQLSGCQPENIYRCELEIKPRDYYSFAWADLDRRDAIFAGACPFYAELLEGVEAMPITKLMQAERAASLVGVLANCRKAYGGAIFTATQLIGEAAVMSAICGDGHSKRLLDLDVLVLPHLQRVNEEELNC